MLTTSLKLLGQINYRNVPLVETTSNGVMINMLASSAVDHGSESHSGQTKDYEIGYCCFSDKHTTRAKTGKLGIRNVPKWRDMSIH
jgi:hypothetical protein